MSGARSDECPTKDRLQQFEAALRKAGVSSRSFDLFMRRAAYPPDLRLAINLKIMLGQVVIKEIDDLLRDGLLAEEYAALVEIQLKGLPPAMLEVGHGLLDVHNRGLLLRSVSKLFRRAKRAKDERLPAPPSLKGVLGDR